MKWAGGKSLASSDSGIPKPINYFAAASDVQFALASDIFLKVRSSNGPPSLEHRKRVKKSWRFFARPWKKLFREWFPSTFSVFPSFSFHSDSLLFHTASSRGTRTTGDAIELNHVIIRGYFVISTRLCFSFNLVSFHSVHCALRLIIITMRVTFGWLLRNAKAKLLYFRFDTKSCTRKWYSAFVGHFYTNKIKFSYYFHNYRILRKQCLTINQYLCIKSFYRLNYV